MAASLGEAYINIKASTKGFAADLSKQLKTVLATAQRDAEGAFKSIAKSAETSSKAATRSIGNAAKAQAQAAQDANKIIVGDAKATYKLQAAAAAAAARAAKAADAERAASAKAADKAIAESARATAKAQKLAIANAFARADIAKAQTQGLRDAVSSVGDSVRGIPGQVFSGIATGAKFATIGVLALGAALIGIGLQSAAALQNTKIAFGALANEIVNGDKAVQSFGANASKVIGDTFTQDLRDLALNSSLAFTTLASVSQQLLSLGFNGEQTKSVIIDVGNALAASGKTGGQLNEDLRGIFTAFSQIKGAGRLLAQDLNQITTRIPSATRVKVYNQLAKDLGLASKNAKSASPELTKARKEVIKLAEAGKISSDTALLSLDKVFRAVSGAGPDAKGLNALQRSNLSLQGQFEQLKETVRNTLADIFDPITEGLAKKLTGASELIKKTLTDNAGSLKTFVLGFADVLIGLVDPLGKAIGAAFGILTQAVEFLAPIVSRLFSAFQDNLPSIKATIVGLAVGLAPLADGLISLTEIAIGLFPFFAGIADFVATLGVALAPVALALRAMSDAFNLLPPGLGETLGIVAGALIALAGAMILIPAAATAASAGVVALSGAVDVLAISLATIGWTELIIILALVGVAISALAKRFDSFRNVLVDALYVSVRATVIAMQAILFAIRAVLESLREAGSFGGKLNPFHKLGEDAGNAADKIKGWSDSLGNAAESIKSLKTSAATTGIAEMTNAVIAGAGSIYDFNRQAVAAGQATLPLTATVGELNAAIRKLPDEKRIQILVDIQQSNANFFKTASAKAKGLVDPGGEGFGFDADAYAASAKKAKKKATNATDDFLNGLKNSLNGAGAGGGGAAGGAADTFRKKIQDILDSIDKEFKTSLVTGTAKQIDTALDSLRKKINDAFLAAKKPPPSKLLKAIDADNTKLKALATERESVLKKLADATARAKQVSDGVNSFAAITNLGLDDIAKAATRARTSLADLSRLRIILPGQDALNTIIGGTAGQSALKANATKFATELDLRLQDIKKFQADIQALIKAGLNKNTIDQIISGGVEGGGGIAATLAGASAETIKSINTTQAAIEAAGKTLGQTAADSLFRSGQSVVDGLIAGLENRRDEIKKAMSAIADDLVGEIRKKLKIKSPSRVTMAIGRFIGRGLEHGLIRSAPAVNKASNALATASIPRYQRISLGDLASMAAADSSFQRPGAPTGSSSSVTHNREVNAPINQTFHVAPGVDHRVLADHIGRGVAGRLR